MSSKYYHEPNPQAQFRQTSRPTARGHESQRFGLILLGNSGVGKSFLANCCLQREIFEHKPKPSAVTRETEYEELKVDGTKYVVFNIPGLIEPEDKEINKNKEQIDKAFRECPNWIVIYVFGTQEGRIRNEDIVAFNALNSAYPFKSKSLILVVNEIPIDRDNDYEGGTITLLHKALHIKDAWEKMCFLDRIDKNNRKQVRKLSKKLFESILDSLPEIHHEENDTKLNVDTIKRLTTQIVEIQKGFERDRAKLLREFRREQKRYEDNAKKQHEQYERELKNMKRR